MPGVSAVGVDTIWSQHFILFQLRGVVSLQMLRMLFAFFFSRESR